MTGDYLNKSFLFFIWLDFCLFVFHLNFGSPLAMLRAYSKLCSEGFTPRNACGPICDVKGWINTRQMA